MRILVTNDDGIDSVGLHVLARRLVPLGDVVIAAPDREYSGYGAAIGTLQDIRPEIHQVTIEGVPEAWAVTGAPALCVFFARLGAFGDIDLVVSGINPGVNTGRAVYHSGTVGAALTARNGGMHAIAISQSVSGVEFIGQGDQDVLAHQQWEGAAEVAAVAAEALLAHPPTDPVVVNVNVPNCPAEEMSGWRLAEVGTTPERAVMGCQLRPKPGHEGTFEVEMEWGDAVDVPPETDGGAVKRNQVAITYLSAFAHDHRDDLGALTAAVDALTNRDGSLTQTADPDPKSSERR